MLAERDAELGTHLNEVTDLCQRTAVRLGIPEEDMTALTQAAALHDVGKSAVPDAILEKAGPLTDAEMMFIRRHTMIGERILGAAPALSKPAKLVRWSHERFEGGGYPDGIGGDEIPIGSRIISVCDAYHAMVSNRAYRPARTPEAAVAELRRCAGTQFDPVVVDAFCEALAESPEPAPVPAGAFSA
jgi:two-component system cell cycle response regulator